MDAKSQRLSAHAVKIIGIGECRGDAACDVGPLLKDRKTLKFMSKQDRLATWTAIQAARNAGLSSEELGERTGVYFTVGYIPFEQEYVDLLAKNSVVDNQLNWDKFSSDAFLALNPLLTFKCLPNMPVYHVSFNLGLKHNHFITYPGEGQWFQCLDRAVTDLLAGTIDFAIVGAVADQKNCLVQHHFSRYGDAQNLIDSASVWVLTIDKKKTAKAYLRDLDIKYRAQDPFTEPQKKVLPFAGPVHGALSLGERMQSKGNFQYATETRDGFSCRIGIEVL